MKVRRCVTASRMLMLIVLVLGIEPVRIARANTQSGAVNRFNVVMVIDASGSMNYTDPEKLRFEAVNQFVTLLTEQGNELGGVVFTERIEKQTELVPADSSKAKEDIVNELARIDTVGDTNIGEALSTAIDMLRKGANKELPSVILLLSDGNTDLPGATEEELQASLDKKAEAVQQARDEGIRIYSVCLNADNEADVSEMRQISEATHGEMIEVKQAEDLQGAFNTFYEFIYNSYALPFDGVFDEHGERNIDFDVPALGVEEVNVILYGYGKDVKYTLKRPESPGSPVKKNAEPKVTRANTFTLLKVTDVVPGAWRLETTGNPGDPIKINLVLNSNLGVRVEVEPVKDAYNPDDELTVRAYLNQGGKEATSAEQYVGYKAELQVLNSLNNQPVETIPMGLSKECFELKKKFEEGSYRLVVHVKGEYLERSSDILGPITVSVDATSEEVLHNTPPKPVENPVEDTVIVWPSWSPVGDKTYELDFTTLATDKQDKTLQYAIVDTSFMPDDYTVKNNVLTVTNFSISKGEFQVRAADHVGATCDIKVIVNSHNVARIVLVVTLAGLAIATLVLVFIFYKLITAKPYGTIDVHSIVNGSRSGENAIAWRGRLKLSRCGLDPIGLDYSKSYIQATGKSRVVLKTNKPVRHAGKDTREVPLENGSYTTVYVGNNSLELHFVSALDKESSPFPRRGWFKVRKRDKFRDQKRQDKHKQSKRKKERPKKQPDWPKRK